jgi:hypothetical protein
MDTNEDGVISLGEYIYCIKDTQDLEFFGSDFEFFTISLLVLLKY